MQKPSPKVVALLATVMLILTVITLLYQREKPFLPQQLQTAILFQDLSSQEKNDPIFQASLTFLQEKRSLKGYEDGTFKPEKLVNRAEFMKMLVTSINQEDIPDPKGPCFKDVKGDEWYARFICYGKEKEWISGYEDMTFRPEKEVNQAEMMKLIAVAMDWDGYTKRSEVYDMNNSRSKTIKYTGDNIKEGTSQWYAKYADLMVAKKIIPENELNPKKFMSRKDVALALFRMLLIDSLKVDTFEEAKIPDLFRVVKISFTPEPPPTPEAPARTKKNNMRQ